MKLLCVIPSYFPAFRYGGPIASLHSLNKALVKIGIDVAIYTTNAGLEDKVLVNQEVEVDGIRVTYFAFTKFFEFMGATGWQFSLPMSRALKNNLKIFDIVYIISIWNYPVAAATYYCRKYKKPYIISPRGLLYPLTIGKKSWKKWPYYYLVAKRDLKGAAAIHYTTEDEAEKSHLSIGLKNQGIIIPNGINMLEFNDLPTKENLGDRYPTFKNKKVILFLGRIHWVKGLDILLKAFATLAKERDDVHLLIVGNDEEDYGVKVKKWITDYGIWDRVTFTGMLLGREKLEAYTGSDIFVLSSYSENFGMVVVEAMACGLPVVISNKVGIYREVERNKAGIVVETNPKSLFKGIKNLLNNENLRKEISKNGKKLVEEYYDIDKVADRMIKVYESIISKGEHL